MHCFTHKLSFLSLSLLLANSTVHAEFSPRAFPFMPRILSEGFFGDNTLGEADAILPLYGNHDSILYIDGLGKTGSDNGHLGSIGGGYRGIRNDIFLWGAYVFGDFNRTTRGPHFPVVNPGLEFMTNLWDIHVNGYFPTSPKQKVEATFLGEQLGTTQYISFAGHNQFDNLVNLVEEVGNGVDGEIGLTLPAAKNIRLYTGGYHFSFKEAQDINGVIGGVEMPLNRYFTVSVRDSYDRVQKNTAQVTIRLTLGGMDKSESSNIHDRLLDPIPRHLGTWDTGSGIPSQQAYIDTGVRVLTRGNIWFFSGAGIPFDAANGFSNCTFENNCLDTSFTQLTIDAIDNLSPGANLYLGPGTYNTQSGTSSFASAFAPHASLLLLPSPLILNERQSIYGRSGDFSVRQLQVVTGTFILTGDNTYDSIFLLNDDGQYTNGLIIAGSVKISNSAIGANSSSLGFRTAVSIEEPLDVPPINVTIENSQINAFTNDGSTATGVFIGTTRPTSRVNLINDIISINATRQTAGTITGRGIFVNQSENITLSNSQVNVQVNHSAGQDAIAEGVRVEQGSVTLENSTLSVNSTSLGGTSSSADAVGLLVDDPTDESLSTVTTRQTRINTTAEAAGTATATGIRIRGFINTETGRRATLFFTGIRLNSQASADLNSTAQGISAAAAEIQEILNNVNMPVSSYFTATASSPDTASAVGVVLEIEGRFNNITSIEKLAANRRDYYSVSALNTTSSTATGFFANLDSTAVLTNPSIVTQATNSNAFLTGSNESQIFVCGIFSLITNGCQFGV
ncbi:Protein of uncharacterised function (DUF3442) [Legionella lansingensis]|uniref:Inverse autotransporter beta-domain domain-containing protein n=1 Tax=Legionella lansingensis TaxID=45067 RepID=A0A0W0W0T7_9GAMM|nr:inverse autotransporter beta-barrel domain-containing protein [Legionella lansingensis]KTD26119.1 hypothetical protein Llan_0014 [Legionella lansingensis]SNV52625.1 Protein of uncharacterised function (DUF3442) [Legionella lansingensis]